MTTDSTVISFPKNQKEPKGLKVDAIYEPSLYNRELIPLYASNISAGLPSPADEDVASRMDLNEHLVNDPGSTFFVRVAGDSMIDVGIHPGDLLVVDRKVSPQSGKVVIAVINGELTVKRLFKEDEKLFLMPENPHYSALEVTQEMDFMIWGVVTNVIHPL